MSILLLTQQKMGYSLKVFNKNFQPYPDWLLHGSPDIIIHNEGEVAVPMSLSTSHDRIVEMAGKQGSSKRLYENLEVIASMCWMIVAHIIKNNTTQHVVCKGLFVDKLLGCGILCKVEARVCDIRDSDETDFVLHASQPYCGRLKPSIICHLLTKLLE